MRIISTKALSSYDIVTNITLMCNSSMRSRFRSVKRGCVFLTSTIKGWFKFPDPEVYYQTIIDTLNYRKKKDGFKLFSYVIMPDHFHLLGYFLDCPNTIKLIKSYSGRLLNDHLQEKYHYKFKNGIWQPGYHPIKIFSKEFFYQKMNYIHNNPLKAGLVNNRSDWKYSSLRNYEHDDGMIEIDRYKW